MGQAPSDLNDVVSESEIQAWTEREKKRRKAWLDGPAEEEKKEWAESERLRRLRRERSGSLDRDEVDEGRRIADRWERDIGWVLSGLANRLIDSRYAVLGSLVREGRQQEHEYHAFRRRRRVISDEDT